MHKMPCLLGLALVFAGSIYGQSSQSIPLELAGLREDVRMLTQRVGELQLRLEQLERENSELRTKTTSAVQSYATLAQLNEAVADLNTAIKSSAATTKNETLQQVSVQLGKLAAQTQAAIDSAVATKSGGGRSPVAAPPPTFTEDYPKEGVTYNVEKGDTIALIAKKTGAKARDIINANKIADPTKLSVGQPLFIPKAK